MTRSMSQSRYRTSTAVRVRGMAANSTGNTTNARPCSSRSSADPSTALEPEQEQGRPQRQREGPDEHPGLLALRRRGGLVQPERLRGDPGDRDQHAEEERRAREGSPCTRTWLKNTRGDREEDGQQRPGDPSPPGPGGRQPAVGEHEQGQDVGQAGEQVIVVVQPLGQPRHLQQAAVRRGVEHRGRPHHPERQQPGGQVVRAEPDEEDPQADVERAEQVLEQDLGAGRTACESIAAPTAAVRRPGIQRAQAGISRPRSTATSSAGLEGLSSSLNR